jgi:general secretion pathway protein A
MYTAFYGLREKPFSLSPNPRFLFFADSHREALAHLRYGIDQGEGFIAITGEVGTGKTTLCRTLLEGLDLDTEVAFLFNPARSATELLQSIAQEFGLSPAGRQRHALNDQLARFLLKQRQDGKRVLLIIDEAQNLDADVLEEVRLISNLETANSKLIQILLLGQPELDTKLDSNELRQLRQRISVRWFLTPLTRAETGEYISHRLRVSAEAERDIFTRAALKEIHRFTGGVPRRINLLCDRALLAGYASEQHRIGRKLVKQAEREFMGAKSGRMIQRWRTIGRASLAVALFVFAVLLGLNVGRFAEVRGLIPQLVSDQRPPQSLTSEHAVSGRPGPEFEPLEVAVGVDGVLNVVEIQVGPDGVVALEELGAAVSEPVYSEPVIQELEIHNSSRDVDGLLAANMLAGPVGSRGERLRNTILPGSFLGRLLDHQEAAIARRISRNAVLESFGMPGFNTDPASDEELVESLAEQELSVLRVEAIGLDLLRSLNHPALLEIETELGDMRLIFLQSLGSDSALLSGVTERGGLEVPLSEIEYLWTGDAYVVWETFEEIPDVLVLGQRGEGVLWLQEALVELGYHGREPSGFFDRPTEDSVMSLQTNALIRPDGAVGPQTQMVLYNLLGRYRVPRLHAQEGDG